MSSAKSSDSSRCPQTSRIGRSVSSRTAAITAATELPHKPDTVTARVSSSERAIWPFALGFFERVRVVAAWCELRQAFRNFRTDRITAFAIEDQRYPRRRHALLKEWREREGIIER